MSNKETKFFAVEVMAEYNKYGELISVIGLPSDIVRIDVSLSPNNPHYKGPQMAWGLGVTEEMKQFFADPNTF